MKPGGRHAGTVSCTGLIPLKNIVVMSVDTSMHEKRVVVFIPGFRSRLLTKNKMEVTDVGYATWWTGASSGQMTLDVSNNT